MLVEQVDSININNVIVPIKFPVAKSVTALISNAGYGISNSTLKRFLVNDCKIKTLFSVSELKEKKNIDPEGDGFKNCKSFRRAVYIHPDDFNTQ